MGAWKIIELAIIGEPTYEKTLVVVVTVDEAGNLTKDNLNGDKLALILWGSCATPPPK